MSQPLSRRAFLRHLGILGAGLLSGGRALRGAGGTLPTPPTLMFHTKDRWKLERIMTLIADQGYEPIQYAELLKAIQGVAALPPKPIILTIDDLGTAYIQPYFLAMAEVIEAAGYRGVFAVVTNETAARTPKSFAVIRELAERGWELTSHTTSHRSLPRILNSETGALEAEIVGSARRMEDGLGISPIALVAPYGNVYSEHRLRVFDERIFETMRLTSYQFLVGIVGGRVIDTNTERPYYVGRVGPGNDWRDTDVYLRYFGEGG
ncbi:MAG TPA: polysaccharide deacetylase family protein [Aggregatilineales bacterium]|nr:polysaccharide deacetylase family protein [Anaerolineales bacterium]HRE46797.1 polysaccharide deacetylase family protein [Aggregatilineales bacterium]